MCVCGLVKKGKFHSIRRMCYFTLQAHPHERIRYAVFVVIVVVAAAAAAAACLNKNVAVVTLAR